MVFFGETWLTGYPAWLDYCPDVALWNHEPTKTVYTRMHKNSIMVPGKETDQLGGSTGKECGESLRFTDPGRRSCPIRKRENRTTRTR